MHSKSKSLLSFLSGLVHDIDEVLFPRVCVVCGKKLVAAEPSVCAGCLSRLPYTCYRGMSGNATERLFYGMVPLVRANSFFYYYPGSDSHRILMALKYERHPELGRFLGSMMAAELLGTGFFNDIDAIVPVPLASGRERRRGYNQSYMLARGVADVTGIPVMDRVVKRVVEGLSQTRLSHSERRSNVEDVFSCICPQLISKQHVLLMDDVVTTGATLSSCMRAMNVSCETRFSVLTLALTVNDFSAPCGVIPLFDV